MTQLWVKVGGAFDHGLKQFQFSSFHVITGFWQRAFEAFCVLCALMFRVVPQACSAFKAAAMVLLTVLPPPRSFPGTSQFFNVQKLLRIVFFT